MRQGNQAAADKVAAEFFSPEELASYLGMPLATVYGWRHRGLGPKAAKVGCRVRYRKRDVNSWLEDQSTPRRPA